MFNIGDKVKLKENLVLGKDYGIMQIYDKDMQKYENIVMTISDVECDNFCINYYVQENDFLFPTKILERVE